MAKFQYAHTAPGFSGPVSTVLDTKDTSDDRTSQAISTSMHGLSSSSRTSLPRSTTKTSPKSVPSDNIIMIVHKLDVNELKELILINRTVIYIGNLKDPNSFKNICKQQLDDFSFDIWIYFSPESSKDRQWIRIICDLVLERQTTAASIGLPNVFDIKMLSKTQIDHSGFPDILHKRTFVTLPIPMKKIAQFLQSHYKNRLLKYEKSLQNKGPLFHVTVHLLIEMDDSVLYINQSYAALQELVEDIMAPLRQELQQLYKIPNVSVIKKWQAFPENGMCLEFRPVEIGGFRLFSDACSNGDFKALVMQHLQVRGQTFAGLIRTEFDMNEVDDVVRILDNTSSPSSYSGERRTSQQILSVHNDLVDNVNGFALRSIVITNIFMQYLKDECKTPYEFFSLLVKQGCLHLIYAICDMEGYNALHMAVIEQRADFLWMLFYSNHWRTLRCGIVRRSEDFDGVRPKHTHKGYTARRVAESSSFKTKGFQVNQEFDYIDQLWISLPYFFKVCLAGSLHHVKIIVESNPNLLDEEDIYQNNCLVYSVASGNRPMVEYLLEKGVSPDNINSRNESCVHVAAFMGNNKILDLLFSKIVDLRSLRNLDGLNALDYCAKNGDLDSIVLLKNKGLVDPKSLITAVKYKKLAVQKFLVVDCGVKVNYGKDTDERTALHHAVIKGDRASLELILQHDGDIKLVDKYNKNVFHLVAEYNQISVMDILAEKAAEIDFLKHMVNLNDYLTGVESQFLVRGKDRGRRAWHWVELLPLHQFAFHSALKSGQIDVSSHGRILYSGFGSSPDESTMKLIKGKQEDVRCNHTADQTPLHIAVAKQHLDVAEKLLHYSAKPNSVDSSMVAPVHLAAMTGDVRLLKLLEEHGANMQASTKDGKQPLEVAQENGHHEIVNFIAGVVDIQRAKNFVDCLDKKEDNLTEDNLLSKRDTGKDIKRYLIHNLRELTIDINALLADVGSSRIAEES